MNNYVSRRESCRLCDSKSFVLVMPVLPFPTADAFFGADKKEQDQPLTPLDLYQCQDCRHVQSLDSVNPDLLFRDYIFRTSGFAGLVKHIRQYAEDITKDFNLALRSLVLEIGSNHGTLLRFFKEKDMRVQGIGLALDIARQAPESAIPMLPALVASEFVAKVCQDHGPAKLVVD